jgi:hypothetical protein
MRSLQTDVMIALAGDDQYITAFQHEKTHKWHGVLMINHPTPSGCERWMMAYSDKRGWKTPKQAMDKFVAVSPEFQKIKRSDST